ncbi:hypothetical protein C9374_011388 [Naegleria lovaniensis]|uniref:Uncharacterized protein n=1 Tax=Naegleria lovaniensis TaxID=51637 RepID=A0AA88KP03_NAELO|nr:uncharacterized protein C9374_011388 [Naegleria lovaniensis]KAG2392663.1 hypothetical protein C9374_011388 [Naegleria lovaniensis]
MYTSAESATPDFKFFDEHSPFEFESLFAPTEGLLMKEGITPSFDASLQTPKKMFPSAVGLTINTQANMFVGPQAKLVSAAVSSSVVENVESAFEALLADSFLPTEELLNQFCAHEDAAQNHHDDSSTSQDSFEEEDSNDEEEDLKSRKKIVAKRKDSKKKEHSSVAAVTQHATSSADRVWSTVYADPSVDLSSVIVMIKTRRDKPSEYLPEKMYSSLKYEIIQKAKGGLLKNVPLLLCRANVVDATTFEEIKKKKPVLKGSIESALTKEPTNKNADEFECKMKVQFDFSYHQDKRLVALELKYYLNDKLDQPILIKRSCPLKVYARKPNKTKRKREEDKEKKLKKLKESQEKDFQDFAGQLEKCFELANKFAGDEKKRAMFTIMQKFAHCFGSDATVFDDVNNHQSNTSIFTDSASEGEDFF